MISRSDTQFSNLNSEFKKKMAADWSDAARYAYASLFALSLNERYSESCDSQFRQQSLHRLLEHVKLMRVYIIPLVCCYCI